MNIKNALQQGNGLSGCQLQRQANLHCEAIIFRRWARVINRGAFVNQCIRNNDNTIKLIVVEIRTVPGNIIHTA